MAWGALFVALGEGIDFWLPMTFILVGVLLFLWEISMPGFFVAVPGTVAIILGLIGLFVPGFLTSEAVLWVGIAVAAPTTFVALRIYRSLAPPDAGPTTTTGDTLVGMTGKLTAAADEDTTKGKVRLFGVIWSARSSEGPIPAGTLVRVIEARGVHVIVRPATDDDAEESPAPKEPAGDAMSSHSRPSS